MIRMSRMMELLVGELHHPNHPNHPMDLPIRISPLQVTLFDKKPANLAQTVDFLSQNRAERLNLRSKFQAIIWSVIK